MNNPWETLGAAARYYADLGYTYVEAPWIVDPRYAQLTGPIHRPYVLYPIGTEGVLVASAEQGLVEMLATNRLAPGRYFAASPCFRDDPLDDLHQRYFLKLELFITPGDRGKLVGMMMAAKSFFERWVSPTIITPVEQERPTDVLNTNYDLVFNGIELGSYGLREVPGVGTWCFGTGVAEPRLSYAVNGPLGPLGDNKWFYRRR